MKLGFWVAAKGSEPLCPSFRLATKPRAARAASGVCFLSRHQQRRQLSPMPARGRAAATTRAGPARPGRGGAGAPVRHTDYAPDDLELITQVSRRRRSADSRRPTAFAQIAKPRSPGCGAFASWTPRDGLAPIIWKSAPFRRVSGARALTADRLLFGARPKGRMNVMPLLAEIAEA